MTKDCMTTTSVRTTAKGLLSTCAFVVAIGVGVLPAAASPEEGTSPGPIGCSHVVWGWPNGADGPAYPGQRFGAFLPPQCRGPVLEGLDR